MLTAVSVAPSCLSETWLMSATHVVLGKPGDPNCWPGTRDLATATTISPALCPDGYTSACDISDATRDQSETVWACCPRNFYCDGGTWSCLADTGRQTKTYTLTTTDALGRSGQTIVTTDRGINAHSIRVAFHASDILNQLSPTSSTTSSNTQPVQTGITIYPTPTASGPADSSSDGLPSGSGIGIGFAIGIGASAVLVAIVWLVRRQRKSKQQVRGPPDRVYELETKAPNTKAAAHSS
ncbi:hypothetical protein F4823DRAFT_558055 [Ustulina deusta]|nr:hypothetical protein F4823DRAFT_558055 [Ustulina deusta]